MRPAYLRAATMLRQMEWCLRDDDDHPTCPRCLAPETRQQSHRDGCDLWPLIHELEAMEGIAHRIMRKEQETCSVQ